MEQILRQDRTVANDQHKAYNGGKAFSSSASGASKSYNGTRSFSLKSFFTRSYWSGKSYSPTPYHLDQKSGSDLAKSADTGKTFATSAMPISAANGIDKSYSRTDEKYATAQGKMEGKSQKSLDLQHQQKPMTIDQVRELLNKSK
jgi:hypothetical protein